MLRESQAYRCEECDRKLMYSPEDRLYWCPVCLVELDPADVDERYLRASEADYLDCVE